MKYKALAAYSCVGRADDFTWIAQSKRKAVKVKVFKRECFEVSDP